MKILRILSLAAVFCSFSSCNTFIGAGRDFQSLGNAMVKKGHSTPATPAPQVAEPVPVAPVPAQ